MINKGADFADFSNISKMHFCKRDRQTVGLLEAKKQLEKSLSTAEF